MARASTVVLLLCWYGGTRLATKTRRRCAIDAEKFFTPDGWRSVQAGCDCRGGRV